MSKLPEGWKLEETSNITIVGAGTGFKIDFQGSTDKDIPFYKVSDMNLLGNEVFMSQANNYIDHEDMKILKAKTFPKNTLIFPKVGAALLTNKRRILTQDSCVDNNIMALIPIESKVDPIFLYSVYLHIDFNNLSNDGALPSLNGSQVKKIKIPLPPLEEQKKIAEILSTVDQKIAFVDNQIEEAELLKKGLMQKLLTQGIGHTEFKDSEVGRIPENWKVKKLSEMIEDKSIISHLDGNHGGLYPKQSEFVDKGIPYLSANMLQNSKIDFSASKYLTEERASLFRKGIAKNNDVLFAHNATVGPVALLKIDLEYVILSTTLTYYRCDLSKLSNLYTLYYMQSPKFVNQYERLMKQSTRNQIPITQQRNLYFILPPLEEQNKIAEILSTTDEKLETLREKKESFEELKKGLMQKLLTGEVRV